MHAWHEKNVCVCCRAVRGPVWRCPLQRKGACFWPVKRRCCSSLFFEWSLLLLHIFLYTVEHTQ
jgi:hypothetical protein